MQTWKTGVDQHVCSWDHTARCASPGSGVVVIRDTCQPAVSHLYLDCRGRRCLHLCSSTTLSQRRLGLPAAQFSTNDVGEVDEASWREIKRIGCRSRRPRSALRPRRRPRQKIQRAQRQETRSARTTATRWFSGHVWPPVAERDGKHSVLFCSFCGADPPQETSSQQLFCT